LANSKSKDILLTLTAFSASALMLTVIQVPFRGGSLAWIALVPFILICRPQASLWRLMWISCLVSFVYWTANLYWIGLVTIPAQIAFSISLALYWPVLALGVRFVRRKGPGWLTLAVPLLFVGAEAWQGIVYTGFGWRLLAHSQWMHLPVIQISDIFGQLGVSFVIALVNGFVAELIIAANSKRLHGVHLGKGAAVAAVLAATVIYGYHRLAETPEHLTPGPMLGSVQTNIPSNVKEASESGDGILTDLLRMSNACFEAGAEIVAWPETIVLSSLNQDYVSLCREDSRPRVYHQAIAEHTRDKGYVLLGAHSVSLEFRDYEYVVTDRFNSAFLYTPGGKQDGRYDKIHLVPFGEYIPFSESLPLLHKLIIKLSPYDYDYNLTKGTEYTVFETNALSRPCRFGVLICYEDTDPTVARKMVVADGAKKAGLLVNISNDGWYVRWKDNKVLPSVELPQRTVIAAFRAIENRVGILRSVNTGISCLIDSTGRIRNSFENGTLPSRAMDRQGVEGWFTDRIELDDRVTLFSRHGRVLDLACGFAVSLIVLWAIAAGIAERQTGKQSQREVRAATSVSKKAKF